MKSDNDDFDNDEFDISFSDWNERISNWLKKMDHREYEKDITIDKDDLVTEWLKQSDLHFYYRIRYIQAQTRERDVKEKLEVIRAEVDLEIRQSDPEDYNLSKFTDKAIDSILKSDDKVIKALEKYNKSKKTTGILQAAVDSLEHKKKALENLSQYWLAGFFSQPSNKKMEEISAKKMIEKNLNKKKGKKKNDKK